MSTLNVGDLQGLAANSNVISVPTGHSLNVADAGGLQIGGSAVVSAGLVFISRTTIGSAVSSVTVSGAFSTDYDNYRIFVSGGTASADGLLGLKFGATASGYKYQHFYGNYTNSLVAAGTSTGSKFVYAGTHLTVGLFATIEVNAPFLTTRTGYESSVIFDTAGGAAYGYLDDATSYTAFTLETSSGTMTGGHVDVYGYAKA